MGKTRDLFNKIRDSKGTFHAKMGPIKDRNYICIIAADNFQLGSRGPQQIKSPDVIRRQSQKAQVGARMDTISFPETGSYSIVPETAKLMEWRGKPY